MSYFIVLACGLVYVFSVYYYSEIAIKKNIEPYGLPFVLCLVPVANTIIVLLNLKYLKQERTKRTKREKKDKVENLRKLFRR